MTDITASLIGITENRYAGGTAIYNIIIPLSGKADGTFRVTNIVVSLSGQAAGAGEGWSGNLITIALDGLATGAGDGKAFVIVPIAFTGSADGLGTSFIPSDVLAALVGNAAGSGDGNSVVILSPAFVGRAKTFAIGGTYTPITDFLPSISPNDFKVSHKNEFDSGELLRDV